MKSNLVIVGLVKGFLKEIGEELADQLAMHYADVSDIIAYSLLDTNEMVKKCGVAYLTEQEEKVIKSIANYENSVISLDYDMYFSNNNFIHFKNTAIVVYVQILPKELSNQLGIKASPKTSSLLIDLIDFQDRDTKLVNSADLIAQEDTYSSSKFVKNIIKQLKEVNV